MAEVNALLDLAAPALREALLVGVPRPAVPADAGDRRAGRTVGPVPRVQPGYRARVGA